MPCLDIRDYEKLGPVSPKFVRSDRVFRIGVTLDRYLGRRAMKADSNLELQGFAHHAKGLIPLGEASEVAGEFLAPLDHHSHQGRTLEVDVAVFDFLFLEADVPGELAVGGEHNLTNHLLYLLLFLYLGHLLQQVDNLPLLPVLLLPSAPTSASLPRASGNT